MSILICSLSFPHTILIGHVQKVNESLTILLIVILTFRRMFSLRDFHRASSRALPVGSSANVASSVCVIASMPTRLMLACLPWGKERSL